MKLEWIKGDIESSEADLIAESSMGLFMLICDSKGHWFYSVPWQEHCVPADDLEQAKLLAQAAFDARTFSMSIEILQHIRCPNCNDWLNTSDHFNWGKGTVITCCHCQFTGEIGTITNGKDEPVAGVQWIPIEKPLD